MPRRIIFGCYFQGKLGYDIDGDGWALLVVIDGEMVWLLLVISSTIGTDHGFLLARQALWYHKTIVQWDYYLFESLNYFVDFFTNLYKSTIRILQKLYICSFGINRSFSIFKLKWDLLFQFWLLTLFCKVNTINNFNFKFLFPKPRSKRTINKCISFENNC